MFLLFAEIDTQGWLPVISGVLGIVATGLVAYFISKRKNNADAAHILAQTNGLLAAQNKNLVVELAEVGANIPHWRKTLEQSAQKNAELRAAAKYWEECALDKQEQIDVLKEELARVPLGAATVKDLLTLAKSIDDHINHIYFIPTGELTESEQSYIRRFGEIRAAAKQMVERLER